MRSYFKIRPSILSDLFTNLASGWFGLLIITPTALLSASIDKAVIAILKALTGGFICLWISELFSSQEVKS